MMKNFKYFLFMIAVAAILVCLASCGHEHTFADATCTDPKTCECGATEGEALGHDLVTDKAVDATCTADGLTEGSHCTKCDYKVAQTVVPAKGHSNTTVVTDPTCTEAGYTTHTCTVCGATEKTDEVNANGHSNTTVVTDPTCTEAGYTTHTCTVCGNTEKSDEVAALGHTFENDACTVCKGVLTKVDPVVGKAYYFGMTQKNVQNKVYYLMGGMSGYYMATTVDPAQALAVYLEATEGGYYAYCFVGGAKTYINMVVSGTHVNGAYEATASTVYTIDEEHNTIIANVGGVDYWFGTRNDNTYTTAGPCKTSFNGFYCEFYEVHVHSFEKGETTAPGCESEGYTTYICSCGASEQRDVEDAKGHKYVDGVCSCGAEDPSVHKHSYTPVVTEPTCSKAGFTTYTCKCGDSYTGDETELAEHVDKNLDITCDYEGCTKRILPPADSRISLFTANHMIIVSLSSSYYVEGTVIEITDAKNGIFVIKDEAGDTILVRLPKNAEGTSYASWTDLKVVVGDTIQVYGKPSRNSSAPTTQAAKIESGVLTVLKHTHSYSEANCTEASVCGCLAVASPALGHLDENTDILCDRCGFNMNLKTSNIVIMTDPSANGVYAEDGNSWTWSDDNFSAIISKGSSTFTLYKTAKQYMQLKKQNDFTIVNKNGATIKSVTIFTTNETQLNNLVAGMTGLTFTTDTAKLCVTVELNSNEDFTFRHNGSTTAYICGVEIVYEPAKN